MNIEIVAKYSKLIPIENEWVDAKKLHAGLQAKTEFNKWIQRRIKGFIEGKDFSSCVAESTYGRPATEYMLSQVAAKKVAMMEKNKIGEEVRDYFILCEYLAKNPAPIVVQKSKLQILADIAAEMVAIEQRQNEVEKRILALEGDDTHQITVKGFANIHKIRLTDEQFRAVGKKASALSREKGVQIGKAKDGKYGEINKYFEEVLKDAFSFYITKK